MIRTSNFPLITFHAFLRLSERFVFLVFDFPFNYLFAANTNVTNLYIVYEFRLMAGVVQVVLESGPVLVFLGAGSLRAAPLSTHFLK